MNRPQENEDREMGRIRNAPRRRILRFHTSTVVILLILVVPYLLTALPASLFKTEGVWLHGWPAIHCVQLDEPPNADASDKVIPLIEEKLFDKDKGILRDPKTFYDSRSSRWIHWTINTPSNGFANDLRGQKTKRFWSDRNNWRIFHFGQATKWFPIGLLLNLTCFITYIVLIAMISEWFRRRKEHWYQFTLLEYGALFALVGAITIASKNEYDRTLKKTKALREFADEYLGGSTCTMSLTTPVWLERLSDLGFDLNARTEWPSKLNSRSTLPASRLPFFCQVDVIDFPSGVIDLDSAIAGVNGLKPRHLYLVTQTTPLDRTRKFVEEIDPKGIRSIVLTGANLDTNLLSRYKDLDFVMLTGELRTANFVGLKNLKVETLHYYPLSTNQFVAEFADTLVELDTLEHFSISGRTHIVQSIPSLPKNLRSLKLSFLAFPGDDAPSVDLRKLPDLIKLENLTVEISQNAAVPTPTPRDLGVVMGRLSRFKNLKHLTIEQHHSFPANTEDGARFDTLTLRQLGLELEKLPLLETLEINGLGFYDELDEYSLNWVTSHPRLKRLFLGHRISRDVRSRVKRAIPDTAILQR